MPDVFTPAKRSAVMSRIRGTGNKDTELRLISLMRAAGIKGWRRGVKLRFGGREQGARPKVSGGQRTKDRGRMTEGGGRRTDDTAGAARAVQEAAAAYGTSRVTPRDRRDQSAIRQSAFGNRHSFTIRPDFVFRAQRLAVFVDGCFFHGCPKHATWPRNNAAFWRAKILGNKARDRLQTRVLRAHGWRVLRIWEHALIPRNAVRTVARVRAALRTGSY